MNGDEAGRPAWRYRKLFFVVEGDPVPYERMTAGELKWLRIPERRLTRAQAARKRRILAYFAYKDLVRAAIGAQRYDRAPRQKAYAAMTVYYRNLTHGDPDNIKKGILDAAFECDKFIASSVDFSYDPARPRVEVNFLLPEAEP